MMPPRQSIPKYSKMHFIPRSIVSLSLTKNLSESNIDQCTMVDYRQGDAIVQ